MPPTGNKHQLKHDLFRGLRFVFLSKSHMAVLIKRVKELQGEIQDDITENVTHVVCPNDAFSQPDDVELPVTCITPDWLSQSIATGQLQDAAAYRPRFKPPQQAAQKQAPAHQVVDAKPPPQVSTLADFPRKRPRYIGSPHPPPQKRATSRDSTPSKGQPDLSSGDSRKDAIVADTATNYGHDQFDYDEAKQACIVERRGSEWIAVQGEKPRFTGGHTGIPWGSYGVWDEPYDEVKAKETVEKVRQHWYRTGEGLRGARKATVLPLQAEKSTNGICGHAACALRPFCLVERLNEVRKAYLEGRDYFRLRALDNAKQQLAAYHRPLDTDDDVDAVGLGAKSAEKVKEILQRGHSSRATEVEHSDKIHACADLMRIWGVGAGVAERWYALGCTSVRDAVAFAAKGKVKLSEQQEVGLKYLDDFEKRIPRAEVAHAEAIVREATFDLVDRMGADDTERTYCRATGSYIRGKPDSGDIDMLIALPPSQAACDCSEFLHRLLAALFERGLLLDECRPTERHGSARRATFLGVCRTTVSPYARRIDFKVYRCTGGGSSAPGCMTGTATCVNYFANSMEFCRATRHWGNTSCRTRAKDYHPQADGFKLSDLELTPRRRFNGGGRVGGAERDGEESGVLLSPPLHLENETQLFEILGLSYVPVTMRYFHGMG